MARVGMGVANGGALCIPAYILACELTDPASRLQVTIVFNVFFELGVMLSALTSLVIPRWRVLSLLPVLAGVLFARVPRLVESPVWLLTRDRAAAREAVLAIAAENGKEVEEVELALPARAAQGDLALFAAWPVSIYFAVNALVWMSVVMGYYGLVFAAGSLSSSVVLATFLGDLAGIPGIVLFSFGTEWWGRRPAILWSVSGSGLCCCVAAACPPQSLILLLTALLGRFFVTGAFAIIYTYGAELFPTGVRSAAVGGLSTLGRLGGMAAPPVAALGHAALAVFGVPLGVGGLLAAMVLPETKGRPLPTSAEEMPPLPCAKRYRSLEEVGEESVVGKPAAIE